MNAAFWPEQNKIYILMPGCVDVNGDVDNTKSTLWVYNVITQSWGMLSFDHVDGTYFPMDITYYKNNLYIAIRGLVIKFDSASYRDEIISDPETYQAYEIPLHSAFTNFERPVRSKFVKGFEPIIKTDFTGASFGMKAVADFERRSSARASVALQDGYNIPVYGAGVEGNYIQYKFDGNSDTASTDGLEVFAVGAIL